MDCEAIERIVEYLQLFGLRNWNNIHGVKSYPEGFYKIYITVITMQEKHFADQPSPLRVSRNFERLIRFFKIFDFFIRQLNLDRL